MSIGKTLKGDLVFEYLAKFPSYPSKTIAAILFEKEPDVFDSVENVRKLISWHRGNHAGSGGRKSPNLTFARPDGKQTDPEGKPWKVVEITFERGLLMGDLHIPFHDKIALETTLKYGRGLKPDCIILNGDILDFYAVSFWERDPRVVQLADEVEYGKCFLEDLRQMFPKARIIYKEGNHEERFWRRVLQKMPELMGVRDGSGLDMVSLGTMLDFKEYGVELVDNKQPILCGEHLHVLHGHEFRQPLSNPVNPARGLYLKAQCNAIAGHLHQSSQHTQTGLAKTISCWSHGGLCNLRPKYSPINSWNLGFATIEISGNDWSVTNKKIINGKVV
jgi:hypothetical protein